MTIRIQVIFYSMYGHVYRMAEAVAQGVREVAGAEVTLLQVPELVPENVLERSGAKQARQAFAHVPTASVELLREADGVLFGTPTRYGNMCAQMRNFLDQTGKLWVDRSLVGKVAGVFAATATQHGGQETTLTSFHLTLLHLGFVVAGLPYTAEGQTTLDEISGGSPYGATTITGSDGSRWPSENELSLARFQGRYLTELARKLKG